MWKQLILPALVVSGAWMLVSPLSTYCLYWLDQSYKTALARNLAAVRGAGQVREVVWRLLSDTNSQELSPDLPALIADVDRIVRELGTNADTAEESSLVRRLDVEWRQFGSLLPSPPLRGMADDWGESRRELRASADSIGVTAEEILNLHQSRWAAAEQHHEHWQGIIFMFRIVLLVVGPALGIALGWWMSQRLHRSISQINIILKDATVEWEQSLAEIRVGGGEDLNNLRERVEKVVDRMRQVSAELDMSRRESLRSDRLAAVGELAAGVAHELRNPLTSVKLLLQNAAQHLGDTRLGSAESRVVLEEIQRMENTIQGLLDFARPPPLQVRPHDLRSTLQRALNLVQGRARQQQVKIELAVGESPILVNGDPDLLHQVFVNLLINGIEAMDAGGRMEVRVELSPGAGAVRIRFRDHGPGIRSEVLTHVFEPFVSTKMRGTGLGLAISRRIVSQHRGSLTAENHPAGGAILTLTLPLAGGNGAGVPAANESRDRETASA
jgi:signal transduction histidine kinase